MNEICDKWESRIEWDEPKRCLLFKNHVTECSFSQELQMPVDDEAGFYDDAEAEPKFGVKSGRYRFPDPPGYERKRGQAAGFMRMTNLAAAFSDQIRLQHWRERMILLGLRADEVLVDELFAADLDNISPGDVRAFLEGHADRAAEIAGAGIGSRRGTARHTMLQASLESGTLTGTRRMRMQLESFYEALDKHYLEPLPGWTERRVCNTKYDVMGTLDMGVMCKLTGNIGILDLKTHRGFWSYLEIAGQQHGYDSADWAWEGPYDDTGRWVRPEKWNSVGLPGTEYEGRRVAYLAHMPQAPGPDQLPVEIHEVCLDYGQEVMEHAKKNIELRSRGQSVAFGRRIGSVRRVPRVDRSTIVV